MDAVGTVAVVRGVGAGLTVTLFDSGCQYTLSPGKYVHPTPNPGPHVGQSSSQYNSRVTLRENSVQATDGRYASTYKMMHCNMTPTSPPHQVTEFPPQRAEIRPGQGNFEIGGPGSGESFCHPPSRSRYNPGAYGQVKDAKGHKVLSSGHSLQADSFATSLRKYPCEDRSSEIIEKLISFTQATNLSKNSSPTHQFSTGVSYQTRHLETDPTRGCDPEVYTPKRLETCPRSEKPSKTINDIESCKKSMNWKAKDPKYPRDGSRNVGGETRCLSAKGSFPERLCPRNRRFENTKVAQRKPSTQWSTNSVNMEIQAAVTMISREVVTAPRTAPSLRTVAVPLTPTISYIEVDTEQDIVNGKTELLMTNILPQTNSNVVIGHKRKDKVSKRQSKSEEKLHHLPNSKTALGINKTSFCKATDKYQKYNRSLKTLAKFVRKLKHLKVSESVLFDDNDYLKCVSVSNMFNNKNKGAMTNQIEDHDDLYDELRNWLNLMSFENNDPTDKQVIKQCIFHYLFELLERTFCVQLDEDYREKLKTYIMRHLEPILLDTKNNKYLITHKLAGSLIMEMTCRACDKCNRHQLYEDVININKENIHQRHGSLFQNDIRKFVHKEIGLVTKDCDPKLDHENYTELEEDLVDFVSLFQRSQRFEGKHNGDGNIEQYIAEKFCDKGLSLKDSLHCAKMFNKHLTAELFKDFYSNKGMSETFIVCPNYQNLYYKQKHYKPHFTISSTLDVIEPDLDMCEVDLCKQIDEWLIDLHSRIPRIQYVECTKVAINDLASDIIDRHKYLKLNLDQSLSNETELEHLKYQIFKWINKLTGESHLELLDHAEELMKRIKQLYTGSGNEAKHHMKTTTDDTNNYNKKSYLQRENIVCNVRLDQTNNSERRAGNMSNGGPNLSIPPYQNTNTNQSSSKNTCCTDTETFKTQDQLETEYENFVEEWVKEIPIELSDPQMSDISEKARQGIYNGLWKIVSKLNCDPATYYNRFLYEDLLSDAIDDLLNCLPQTELLKSKRHLLKAKYIEKTVETNEKIKEIEEASYKNKLTKSFIVSLRKQGITRDDNPVKLHEDLQILKIVEDYLLSVKFKDEDKIKSELYKRKLQKEVEYFIIDLKRNHARELQGIDSSVFQADIINILQKVTVPNENTMQQEADGVLLGMEIEQWYSDLPIIPNDDHTEQYQRRRQRDILAKKIKALEVNNDSEAENGVRHEISKFLERAPLEEGESLNINFMVDELVNRLKNKYEADVSFKRGQSVIRSFEDFKKDVPRHSTATSQQPSAQKSQCNSSCKRHRNEYQPISINSTKNYNHVVIKEPPSYRMFKEDLPVSSSFNEIPNMQWHTLEESRHASRKEHIHMQSVPPSDNNTFPNDDFIRYDQQNMIPDCCRKGVATTFSDNDPKLTNTSNISPSRQRTEGSVVGTNHLSDPNYLENGLHNANTPQFYSPDQFRYSNKRFNEKQPFEQNEGNKRSVESQTERPNGESPHGIDSPQQSKISRAINTSAFSNQNFASTPPHINSLSMPSVPSKKKTRWSISDKDKDNVKRNLDFEDTEEDDSPCRCLEKYWKTCHSRQHLNEDHHCPPYLPIFLPYPYPYM